MKKFVFSVVCLSLIAFKANALSEGCTTYGLSFQNLINVSGDDLQSPGENNGMLGINMNGYTFWNGGNIGLFLTDNILFGLYGKESDITILGLQAVIGPGFRYAIDSNLTFLGGLGMNFFIQFIKPDQAGIDNKSVISLGAGGASWNET